EAELLLCASRASMDSGRAERIRALVRQSIDWGYVLGIGRRHGVLPLLYWHLSKIWPDAVPKAILKQLRDQFQQNTLHNLFLTGELLKLLNLFQTHGIRAITYKGPTLAMGAYGNLALRQFNDLDLLVRKNDIPKAREL